MTQLGPGRVVSFTSYAWSCPPLLKLGCAKLRKMRWTLAAALLAPMVISAEESESRRERRFEFTYVAGIEVPTASVSVVRRNR